MLNQVENNSLSGAVEMNSDTTILDWADRYTRENYRRVRIAEIFPEDLTAYFWGDEAASHVLQSPSYMLLLERRDARASAILE